MRISPIYQNNYKPNIYQQKQNYKLIQANFQGVKPKDANPSKLCKFGCYALAVVAAPFVLIGFLGDFLTECLTGEKTNVG